MIKNRDDKSMTSKQRLEIALGHKEPDRVPFDLGSTKMTGISMTAYTNLLKYKKWDNLDPDPAMLDIVQQLARVGGAVLERTGVDTRGIYPSAPSGWSADYITDRDYIKFIDEWGIGWRKPIKGGFYFDMVSHPLPGDIIHDELKKYRWPDSLDKERTSQLEQNVESIKKSGDYGITMHGFCSGVMEMALRIRGFEQFFMDLAIEPEFACEILDRMVDLKIAYWNRALELVGNDIQVAVEPDDLGTQDSLLISPEMYRKYLKPRHLRLFSFIKNKAPHIKVFLHSCGAIKPLIPDLIEAGVDILNPVQVSARGMDTKLLKKEFGKDLVFWGGGIDTQNILPHGTLQQVRDEVKRRLDDLAPGGGFVFNTVHNIQADVPPQNIEAMLETLEVYGKYR